MIPLGPPEAGEKPPITVRLINRVFEEAKRAGGIMPARLNVTPDEARGWRNALWPYGHEPLMCAGVPLHVPMAAWASPAGLRARKDGLGTREARYVEDGGRRSEAEPTVPSHPPYPWCYGYPTREDCIEAGYCRRNPTCGD